MERASYKVGDRGRDDADDEGGRDGDERLGEDDPVPTRGRGAGGRDHARAFFVSDRGRADDSGDDDADQDADERVGDDVVVAGHVRRVG